MRNCPMPGIAAGVGIFLISLLASLLAGGFSQARGATFEIGLGGWQQTPTGYVAYTYNVADVATDTAEGVVHDIFPCLDTNLFEKLKDRINEGISDLIPSADPEATLNAMFTRTDTLDFQDDCNFGTKVQPMGRMKINVSPFVNFSFMATPLEFDGEGMKNLSFVFMDVTFAADHPFSSKIRLTHYDMAYFIDFPEASITTNWKLHADLGLNVRVVDFYAEVSQPYSGLTAHTDYLVPLPMFYFAAQVRDKKSLCFETEARFTFYRHNYTYSVLGRMRAHIKGPLYLAAGFRQDYITFDIKDIKTDTTISGPFIETVLVF
jgi:hypothetical protein